MASARQAGRSCFSEDRSLHASREIQRLGLPLSQFDDSNACGLARLEHVARLLIWRNAEEEDPPHMDIPADDTERQATSRGQRNEVGVPKCWSDHSTFSLRCRRMRAQSAVPSLPSLACESEDGERVGLTWPCETTEVIAQHFGIEYPGRPDGAEPEQS